MMSAVITVVVILLDQFSKMIIQNNASLQNVEVIRNFFYLTYVKNTGMAWSLLSGQVGLLSVVSAAAIGGMIWYLVSQKTDRLTKISLALMIGGAAGNLADRLYLGAVRDFLDFYIFGYNFPVFNIADSALTIGVILLFIKTVMDEKNEQK